MKHKNFSAIDAKYEAQKIAFAPVIFQVSVALRDFGVLNYLFEHKSGASVSEMHKALDISKYGLKVLLELGFECGVVEQQENDNYTLSKTGYYLLRDEMTRVNMDFIQDVCYKGLFHLKDSIKKEKPAGLKVLGDWPTIYAGLKDLDKKVQDSWFAFDHFYSDDSFPEALKVVFRSKPKHLIDVGGNTGNWAIACCNYNPDIQVTIVDLPGQLKMAAENVKKAGLENRISYEAIDLLNPDKSLPKGDVIWMSQFLDCFSENEIVSILKHVSKSMDENTRLFIMETFWDNQKFPAASLSLAATSVYFTTMANGNSKMYGREDFLTLIEKSGLSVEIEFEEIGISHTILKIKKKQ
jgi:ubiquinone/menaquinone biosynthesis C-methylase UbiE